MIAVPVLGSDHQQNQITKPNLAAKILAANFGVFLWYK